VSLSTPKTSDISDNIISQIQTSLNQTIPALPKSFTRVLAKAVAGVFILLYKYAGFMFLQLFVQTASDQETEINGETVTPLTLWGRLVGVGDPSSAVAAQLSISVTVETQGGTLPSYSQLTNSTNGVTYVTTSSVLLDADTVTVTIKAVSDQSGGNGKGAIGNLEAGDEVKFVSSVADVATTATVLSQVVTGSDAEDTDDYRQRIIDEFQARPQGGAYSDYRSWGSEVTGITNIYPYSGTVPGTVEIYAEATEDSSGSEDGIPTDAQLTAVAEAIEYDEDGLATRRPVGANVIVSAITRTEWVVTVSGLIDSTLDSEADAQEAVTAAVEEYFLAREPYIVGLDVLPRYDTVSRSAVIGAVEDVMTARGGTFSTATLALASAPTVDLELQLLTRGEKVKASVVFES